LKQRVIRKSKIGGGRKETMSKNEDKDEPDDANDTPKTRSSDKPHAQENDVTDEDEGEESPTKKSPTKKRPPATSDTNKATPPPKKHPAKHQDSTDTDTDSPPPKLPLRSKISGTPRKQITCKIRGKREFPSLEETPRKTIKSRIGRSKPSRGASPMLNAKDEKNEVKKESQEEMKSRVLSAGEKALEKRMLLKRELEKKRGKEVKKVRKF
jgi:hypothetical protein